MRRSTRASANPRGSAPSGSPEGIGSLHSVPHAGQRSGRRRKIRWRSVILGAVLVQMALGFPACGGSDEVGLNVGFGSCTGRLHWANGLGGAASDRLKSVAVMPDGSFVVAGSFEGTLPLPSQVAQTPVKAAGGQDLLVARYRPDGELQWLRTAGGGGADEAAGVVAMADGSIVITGSFQGSAAFGSGEARTVLQAEGDSDVFVARFDPSGNLDWALRAGGPGADRGTALAALPDGAVIVAGISSTTEPPAGAQASGERVHAVAEPTQAFVARYERDGRRAWSRLVGGGSGRATSVAVLDDGSSVVTGSTAKVGGAPDLDEEGLFVARLRSDGSQAWIARSSGAGAARGEGISVLSDGSSLVTGLFTGSVDVGASEKNATTLTSSGGSDVLIVRYDPAGKVVWARRAGGPGEDSALAIRAVPEGPFFVTGQFSHTATFGAGEEREARLVSAGGADAFVALYSARGELIRAQGMGGPGDDTGNALATWPLGHVLVSGSFSGTVVFGAGEAGERTLTSQGALDGFLLLLGP